MLRRVAALQEGVTCQQRVPCLQALKTIVSAGVVSGLLTPLQSFGASDWTTVFDFARGVREVIDLLFPVLFALILLVFLWGLVKFVWSASKEEQAKGKSFMVWGVVALFVAASVWGLVALLVSLLGVETEGGVASNPTIQVNRTTNYGP